MKFFRYFLILFVGFTLGSTLFYFLGKYDTSNIEEQPKTKDERNNQFNSKPKIIYQTRIDTVVIQENAIQSSVELLDSSVIDTFLTDILIDSNNIEEDYEIVSEKLIISKQVKINAFESADSNQVVELLKLNTKEFNNIIIVEYWDSPLELTGYELSRSKLKLFGFNSFDEIELCQTLKNDEINLRIGSDNFLIQKRNKFSSILLK